MSRGNGGFARVLTVTGAALLAANLACAQVALDPTIENQSATAQIDVGGLSATLTIRFENVVGLSAANLGLSAFAIDPLSSLFATRLGGLASVPGALPLVVRIEPPASGGLSFSGIVSVELYTHELQYTVGSPLRLYSAPLGGTFTDITTSLNSGSVRSGGTKPDFSEFMIVADLRPLATVIDGKYTQLGSLLAQHKGAMSAALHAELANLLTASRTAWQSGATVAAIEYIEAFSAKVKAKSGSELPDVWRATRDLANVAGALRSSAATLRFSLTLASNT
jgi:hypothetical protein